jgi:hypothetical protein
MWGNFEGKEIKAFSDQPSITQVISTDIFPQMKKVRVINLARVVGF